MVLDRELVDDADQGGNVGTELVEFAGFVIAGRSEFGDRLAESGLNLGGAPAFSDVLIEIVFQVGVPLCEGVAGHLGFVCERHDGQGAV
ncbi:hypothetical protein BEL07_08475 [Mycolicibacterium grossiae]|uniref:Uncharacterized protein n=1 Tax=Mycolicibacterium grossiae TaxID=1552759 RepID=A0A1E8Q8F9_9MYCO|nr:hypothetical protein BEL07_08475 [Mycolicibacterium grossiae]